MKQQRRAAKLWAAMGVACALLFIHPTTAQATNWAGATGLTGCSGLNKADDKVQTYWPSNLTSPWANALSSVDTYIDGNTVVLMSKVSSVATTTDQVLYDEAYTDYCRSSWWTPRAGGVVGKATCVSINSAKECEKHETRFTTAYTSNNTATRLRSVMLHETGHALGLAHREVSGEVMQGQTNDVVTFSTHDKDHLNSLS